jgi:hypothetical protein
MGTQQTTPDLTFVRLIHQALRIDAARLVATVDALRPEDRTGRVPRVRTFYDKYREELVAHHTHEDTLYYSALAARVGADRMTQSPLTSASSPIRRRTSPQAGHD